MRRIEVRDPDIVIPVLMTLMGVIVYSNSFHVPFLYDDSVRIVFNDRIRMEEFSWSGLINSHNASYPYQRPVAYMSFALNYYFGGLNPFGYHLVNLLIHILTGTGVYFLVKLTLGINSSRSEQAASPAKTSEWERRDTTIAALAAILWLVSAVQTQAVTYIVQRMTSMSAFFYVLSLLFYVKGRISPKVKPAYLIVSFLFFLLSAGTKQTGLTLPLIILLYEFCFLWKGAQSRVSGKVLAMVFILSAVLFAGILVILSEMRPGALLWTGYATKERILTEARVFIHYIGLMLFPIPSKLVFLYDFPFSRGLTSPPSTSFALLAVVGAISGSILVMRRYPIVSFFSLWFFLNLLPESLYLDIEPVFEHRLYVPSIGFYVIAACLGATMWDAAQGRNIRRVLILFVLVLFSVNTYCRNMDWRDEISFWSDNVKKSPNIPDPYEGLGMAYLAAGQLDKAEKALKRAKWIDPLSRASLGLGTLYFKRGDYEMALGELEYIANRKALGAGLRYFETDALFYYMGEEFLKMGRSRDAVKVFRMGLFLNPENMNIRSALAGIERRQN